jgi:hypothetical protein
MIVTEPLYIYINILLCTTSFFLFVLYLRHIRKKAIINKVLSNLIAIPISFIMIYWVYIMSINIHNEYNLWILIHHTLLNIPIIILSLIWIIRKK